jgi:hypothetical protein
MKKEFLEEAINHPFTKAMVETFKSPAIAVSDKKTHDLDIVLTSGKYRNIPISEIPVSYLRWLAGERDEKKAKIAIWELNRRKNDDFKYG